MTQNRLAMTFLLCPPYDIIIWAGQERDMNIQLYTDCHDVKQKINSGLLTRS